MNKKAVLAVIVIIAVCVVAVAVIYIIGLDSAPPTQLPTPPLLGGARGPTPGPSGPIGASPYP